MNFHLHRHLKVRSKMNTIDVRRRYSINMKVDTIEDTFHFAPPALQFCSVIAASVCRDIILRTTIFLSASFYARELLRRSREVGTGVMIHARHWHRTISQPQRCDAPSHFLDFVLD